MSGQRIGKSGLYLFFKMVLLLTPFLYLVAAYNYLAFHSLVEGVSVFLSFSIFIAGERVYSATQKQVFLALSVAYFFIALLDLLHLCTYYGMRLLPISDPNIPTQLWVGARYLEAFSLAIAASFFTKTYHESIAYVIYGLVVTGLAVSIFAIPLFPTCFILGEGLTTFKIASEFVVIALLLLGIFRFSRICPINAHSPLSLIPISMSLIIAAEVFFTSYADVYGFTNFTGHILTIIARFILYYAVAQTNSAVQVNKLQP